jgi:type III secretion protein L
MDVWFRHGSCTVGVTDGVVRARNFASFVSLLDAADAVQSDRLLVQAEAQAQAQQVLETAQQQADTLLAEAQAERDRAYEEGFEAGRLGSLARWAQQALTGAQANQRSLERQRERLGGIVSLAVERMVDGEDRQALYQRALRTISKLVKDVPMITMRVHSDDLDAAQQALSAVADQHGVDMPIEVVGDEVVAEGCCRFESDQGVIDAGLMTQLAAIKRAVVRAAHASLEAAEPVAPSDSLDADGDDGNLDGDGDDLDLDDDSASADAPPSDMTTA